MESFIVLSERSNSFCRMKKSKNNSWVSKEDKTEPSVYLPFHSFASIICASFSLITEASELQIDRRLSLKPHARKKILFWSAIVQFAFFWVPQEGRGSKTIFANHCPVAQPPPPENPKTKYSPQIVRRLSFSLPFAVCSRSCCT